MSSPKDAERNEGQQDFPHDEFDELPYDARYYGTHRKAMPQVRQRNSLKWVIFAGVFALIIGAFSFLILPTLTGNNTNGPGSSETETESSQQESATKSPSESPTSSKSASEQKSPQSSTPATSESPSPSEESSSSSPAANVNYGLNVEVYNTAAAPGAAAQAGQTLRTAGFTVPVTANWQGFTVTTSTVYYASEAQKDTAQAVADALGVDNVEQRQVPAIVVVLASN